MIPHKQLNRHKPEDGIIGDCWRTCFASLLDKDSPDDVPHFLEDCWQDSEKGRVRAREYLATQGLDFVEYAFGSDLETTLGSVGACNPNLYYMLGGNSKNGCGHSVICINDRIVHDPSRDDSGIVGPMDDGMYWIGFLVPAFLKGTQ